MKSKDRFASVALALLSGLTAQAGVIPIEVNGDAPDSLWPAPVKCGVPFPQGAYKAGDPVVLVDGTGAAQPAQTAVTATWDPKGEKGVRWLLLDFLAERGKEYRLVFGADAKAAPPATPPIAQETDAGIVIDTGPLKAQCSKKKLDIFSSFQVKNRHGSFVPMTQTNLWAGYFIEHEKRGVFRADLDPEPKIILEENGPIRATIRAEGWYANEAGEKFCQWIVRLHFFKGKGQIKTEPTFIFTGKSNDDRLRDIGLQLPLAGQPPKQFHVVFGAQTSDDTVTSVPGGGYDHESQAMDSPDGGRRFEYVIKDLASGEIARNGERAAGFIRAWTEQADVLAIVRDAWQQFPLELEWEKGVVRVHLWPKHGRLWDTSFDGIWYFLTDQQKRYMVSKKPGAVGDKFQAMWDKLHLSNAHGAAKTHEVWLFCGGIPGHWDSSNVSGWNYVQNPIYAHADLDWQCKTRALDRMPQHPYDLANFPDEENYAETMLDMVNLHAEHLHLYGWWDWRAYHQHMALSIEPMRFADSTWDNTGYQPNWHRAKPKSHYFWGSYPWLQYFRTGSASWLRYGQGFSLYSADMVFRHATDRSIGRIAGEEYHYDHSEMHWIGGYSSSPGGAMPFGNVTDRNDYIYQYWLTGDRRPFDVLKLWAEQYSTEEHAGKKWVEDLAKAGPYGNTGRNIGGAMRRLCTWYEATWDPRFLEYADILARSFYDLDVRQAETQRKNDKSGIPSYHMHSAWMYEGMWQYYQLTGDEKLKKTLLDYLTAATNLGAGFFSGGIESGSLNWCSYGYDLTKDPLYLDLGRRMMDREMAAWVSHSAFTAGGRKFRSVSIPRFIGTMMNAPKEWREKNVPANQRGISLDLSYFNVNWNGATRRVFLLDEQDRAFTIHFGASQAGTFAVFDPDGKLVAKSEPIDWQKSLRTTITVPKDGKKGTYTFMTLGLGKTWYNQQPQTYAAVVNIIACDLPRIVYEVASAIESQRGFTARAWYVGVPAKADKVEIHWRPSPLEAGGQRHFVVSEVGGPYRMNSADLTPVDRSTDNHADFHRYTFRIPPTTKDRIFRCEPLHEAHTVLAREMYNVTYGLEQGFAIVGAPAVVATSPESYFVPTPPKEYEKTSP